MISYPGEATVLHHSGQVKYIARSNTLTKFLVFSLNNRGTSAHTTSSRYINTIWLKSASLLTILALALYGLTDSTQNMILCCLKIESKTYQRMVLRSNCYFQLSIIYRMHNVYSSHQCTWWWWLGPVLKPFMGLCIDPRALLSQDQIRTIKHCMHAGRHVRYPSAHGVNIVQKDPVIFLDHLTHREKTKKAKTTRPYSMYNLLLNHSSEGMRYFTRREMLATSAPLPVCGNVACVSLLLLDPPRTNWWTYISSGRHGE